MVARVGDVHGAAGSHGQAVRLVELHAVPPAVRMRAEPERAGRLDKPAGVVEDLQAVVPRVGHYDAAVGVDGDVVRALEPAVLVEQAGPRRSPDGKQGRPVGGQHVYAPVELVGDVDAAVWPHVDAGRRPEQARAVEGCGKGAVGRELEDSVRVDRSDVHGAVGAHRDPLRRRPLAAGPRYVELRLVCAVGAEPLYAVVCMVRDEYVAVGRDCDPRGEPELAVARAARAERPVVDVRPVFGQPCELDAVVAAVGGDDAAVGLDRNAEHRPKLELPVIDRD